ncbi:MAG: outer membrane beta-barrel protein [Acidobacteriota bacterium]
MKHKILSAVLILLALMFFNSKVRAQETLPKFEAGGHFIALYLHDFDEGPAGAGVRFTYNITDNFSLELEADHFPENPSGNFGESLALAGLKAGKRNDTFGVFGKVRPGVIHLGGDFFSPPRLDKSTFFAVDVSGALEYYPTRRLALRFEVGDMIIAYRGARYLSASRPEIVKLGASHNLQTTLGFSIRF